MLLLNPRRTRTNMKLLQLVWIFLLTLCGQSAVTAMTVKEDDDVILDCSCGTTDIKNAAFDWKKDVDQNKKEVFFYSQGSYYGHGQTGQDSKFEGRVFHFPDQLQFGNASIKITKAKTSDSGTYTCYYIPDVRTPQPEIRSSISLTVGASPEPYVELLEETQNSALLCCIVRGAFPKPEVVWTDSDGKILDADEPKVTERDGNKYDIILNVTVTKSDRYRCVATQKEINHQVYGKTLVQLNGAVPEPSVANLGDTKDGVLLQCVVRRASPKLKLFFKNSAGHVIPAKKPQKTQKGGGYDIILQATVKKTDYYRCVTTEGKNDDEVHFETFVLSPWDPRSSVSRLVPAAVVGVLGLVASVVV